MAETAKQFRCKAYQQCRNIVCHAHKLALVCCCMSWHCSDSKSWSAGEDLVSIDSFVQHNATACAYLAFLSDTLSGPTPTATPCPSLSQHGSSTLTLDQLLNGYSTKAQVPAVYKTCLSECILGTTDFDAVLIGLSDLYEQVSWQMAKPLELTWPGGSCMWKVFLAGHLLRQHACIPLQKECLL